MLAKHAGISSLVETNLHKFQILSINNRKFKKNHEGTGKGNIAKQMINKELKQTGTMTATRILPNKRFNEQNNSCALAYKSLYIPLPSSAKQEREMTKFCVV